MFSLVLSRVNTVYSTPQYEEDRRTASTSFHEEVLVVILCDVEVAHIFSAPTFCNHIGFHLSLLRLSLPSVLWFNPSQQPSTTQPLANTAPFPAGLWRKMGKKVKSMS